MKQATNFKETSMNRFKNIFIGLIAVLATVFAGSFAHAQQLRISSGGKDGTYWLMTNQMAAACGNDGSIVNVEQTGGTPATITAIQNNVTGGGIVQFDALWMRSRGQDLTFIKTLLPLHKEQVHFVTLSKGQKKGGFMGVGGDTVHFNDVRSLKGLPVGAAGGSVYTAQAVNQLSGIGYLVQSDYKDTTAVLDDLVKGKIAAAVVVGGAPMGSISKLSRDFRLVPFDAGTVEKLKDVYRPTSVVYDNFGTTSTPTVETDALLVVNNFSGKKMVDLLTRFRECVKANLADLRETDGNHPAWRNVKFDTGEKPKWAVW